MIGRMVANRIARSAGGGYAQYLRGGLLQRSCAQGAVALVLPDLGFYVGKPCRKRRVGIEVEHREQSEAAGTCRTTILP